jgi:hypothetical protein
MTMTNRRDRAGIRALLRTSRHAERSGVRVRFPPHEAPPRAAALPLTAERLPLAERLHSGSCQDLIVAVHLRAEAVNVIARGSQH